METGGGVGRERGAVPSRPPGPPPQVCGLKPRLAAGPPPPPQPFGVTGERRCEGVGARRHSVGRRERREAAQRRERSGGTPAERRGEAQKEVGGSPGACRLD